MSTFRYSSFCKGLIVYRKSPYIANNVFGFANYTYLYMRNPYIDPVGSYIKITNCVFSNLNIMANVTALADYAGKEVLRLIPDYSGSTSIYYQGIIHKGIVLNIEDFMGYVEIYNSDFNFNFHFIPQILITNYSSTISRNIESFREPAITKEYKMA